MEDIAPELLERIRERFENAAKGDGTLLSFLRRAEQETATLGECGDYADRLGELLAKALAAIVTPQALPNGILYQNIAEKLLKPTLREVYERVNVSAARVQKAEDARRHIGLNAVKPDFPDERVRELSYVAGRPENTVEQALSYLQEPVRTISRSFFDDFVRENAKARWRAGMDPVVSREVSPKCCDWCAALAGNWDYDDARTEGVFRRHQFCRCTVTYSCDGRAQDVWSKKFYDVDAETIKERAEQSKDLIRTDHETLREREKYGVETRKKSPEEMQADYEARQKQLKLENGGERGIIEKETGSALFSSEVKKRLYQHERIIAGNRYETAILYDANGKLLFQKKGDSDEVRFDAKQIKQMRGGVLTHNHPNDSCFSPSDLNMARRGNLAEIRVATSDGVFAFRPNGAKWPKEISTIEGIQSKMVEAENSVLNHVRDRAAQEGMTAPQYLRLLDVESMNAFCQQYGFEFSWQPNEESEFHR